MCDFIFNLVFVSRRRQVPHAAAVRLPLVTRLQHCCTLTHSSQKLRVKHRQNTCRDHGLTNSPGQLCASVAFAAKLKCRPASPPNLLFHIKCRCPVSCPRSQSHSSCSTCPSLWRCSKTTCLLDTLLSLRAPLNSARNSPTLRPKPRLASATCARLGSRGMLSPSFRRPRVLVQTHLFTSGLTLRLVVPGDKATRHAAHSEQDGAAVHDNGFFLVVQCLRCCRE